MNDGAVSDIVFGQWTEAQAAAVEDLEPACGRRNVRPRAALVSAATGLGLLLAPPAGELVWPQLSAPAATECSAPVAEAAAPGATLRELARTAVARMTPEQRALYDGIVAFRESFTEPFDVDAMLREFRDDVEEGRA